ncbi:MAG TPA: hypothetical protein VF211_03740 [Burkholderiales bacterium]
MRRRGAQSGAALLLLVTIVVIAFTTVIVRGFGKWAAAGTASRNVNGEVLALAKAALIGHVAKQALDFDEDVPGRLPCPESPALAGTSGEGVAAATCSKTAGTQKTLGRLPWRTLGIDKLTDAAGEPLWYAVSQDWVTTGGGPPTINAGTAGSLSFDGTGNVVAVIFAPGRAIATNPSAAQIAAGCAARNQRRGDRSHVPTSSADPDYRDYLECQNASSPLDDTFGVAVADEATSEVINDQAVLITAADILNAIQGPLAERLQRTVAPLLSEYGDQWIGGGKFLPYAVAFTPPESGLPGDAHCGPSGGAQQTEGLLPVAANVAPCASGWTGDFSGDGIEALGCDTGSPVNCSFRYFRLNFLGQLLLGITGTPTLTATLSVSAPHAAASFRSKTVQSLSDVSVSTGAATLGGFSIAPQTDGDVDLTLTATVTSTNLCRDSLLGGLTCLVVSTLGLANAQTVTVTFPQLGTPSLAGSKLTSAAKNGTTGPYDLLSPAAGEPHYWFMRNQWYRYTYYAVAPDATAAQSGGTLTVNRFPTAYGANSDKRFVLALMGPALAGQSRSATAALGEYVEGDNAAAGASPREFAYQVFADAGNDRLATCPFGVGSSVCD